jgi:hypothetical protein
MKRAHPSSPFFSTGWLWFLGLLLLPVSGHAQASEEKMACLAAHEGGQDLRKTGKLKEARAKFARCAQSTCPGPIVSDCTQRSSEVQQAIPTVVFAGVGTDGKETSAIKVLLNGMPLVERLDGKSIELDPGEHTFQFEHNGKAKQETFIIREGERNRVLSVSFHEKPETSIAKPPEKQPPEKQPPERKEPEKPPAAPPLEEASGGSKPTALLVTGLAGLGVGLGFGTWALSLKGTVADKCDPSQRSCVDDQGKDAAKLGGTVSTISTVGTVVGLAGLGAWLLWPSRKETSTARLDAGPVAGGGMVRWQGSW